MRGVALLGFHVLSRVAFRVTSPRRAKAALDRIARRLPPLRSVDEARLAVRELGTRGTCLTRAATVASLLPGSEVVIGVDPRRDRPLRAHAWVVVGDERLDVELGPDDAFVPLARMGPSAPNLR